MAVISVKDEKMKKVIVTSAKDLLDLADKIAPGMKDAILEFFVDKADIPEVPEKFEDFEGPDEDLAAGMDNEYFEDEGDPV